MSPTVEIYVDSFAGGGGASLGIELATGRSPDIAINHDAEAIALHAANHPDSKHYAEDVWKVDPVEACAGRPVGLMWLSPDCKDFSKAKGGRPVSKRVRGLAWVAVRWAKAVKPRVIILENVEEFQGWGPLLPDGRRDPEREGRTFRMFVGRLRGLGYEVQWRELRACDYGAPTIRKRLFLIARCDGRPIVWPRPTHGPGRPQPWRTAAECIDWSLPCPSIFLTKDEARAIGVRRPLAEATMRRIARGVRRYVIESPRPFVVNYHGPAREGDYRVSDLTEPLPTQTTENRFGLVVPFLTEHANGSTQRNFDVVDPLRTQCAGVKGGHFALAAPFLIPRYGEDPHRNGGKGQEPRTNSVEEPLRTIVPTGNGAQLVAAFMAQHNTDVVGHAMTEPVSTIVGKGCTQALVSSHLLKLRGTSLQGQLFDDPAPTITAGGNHLAEVRAFLVSYYGTNQNTGSLHEPAPTITAKDRLGLVTIAGTEYVITDIGMRMLAPRELYNAQGFSPAYRIDIQFRGKPLSKTAQVRMVGNSVCPPLAAAIITANLYQDAGEAAAA